MFRALGIGAFTVDERLAELDRNNSASGLLGYLNFSQGRPDPRWQRQFADAFAFVATRFTAAQDPPPWVILHRWLGERLETLQRSGSAAFQDVTQVRAVLHLLFDRFLTAYRRHHVDLLAHLSDRELFQPFFLVRIAEAILTQGGPWNEEERIITGRPSVAQRLHGLSPHRRSWKPSAAGTGNAAAANRTIMNGSGRFHCTWRGRREQGVPRSDGRCSGDHCGPRFHAAARGPVRPAGAG